MKDKKLEALNNQSVKPMGDTKGTLGGSLDINRMEFGIIPHVKRRGWLKNSNPPGDPSKAPRCGAKSKRTQLPCRAPAMKNGRCRFHGGKSTGPKTEEGRSKIAQTHLKSGKYTKKAREERRYVRYLIKMCRVLYKKPPRV